MSFYMQGYMSKSASTDGVLSHLSSIWIWIPLAAAAAADDDDEDDDDDDDDDDEDDDDDDDAAAADDDDDNNKMLPRRTRAPRRIEIGTGEPTYPMTAQDYYRRKFYKCCWRVLKDGDYFCFDEIIVKIKELPNPEREMMKEVITLWFS